MNRIIAVILFLIFFTAFIFPQSTDPIPEPYAENEFPQWLKDLRRAEIILIGSFPLTLLFSSLAYDIFRYSTNNFSNSYLPSLFGNTNVIELTKEEKKTVLYLGISISGIITGLDFILGKIDRKNE